MAGKWRITLTLLFSLAPVFRALAAGPPEWPQYRLHPNHNAVYENQDSALPSAAYKTKDQVRATPVVVGDRLYVGNHDSGGMFAFELASTKMLWGDDNPWFRHAPNWIHSDMVFVNGRIFVGYGNRMFDSAEVRGTGESGVLAVDPETGATLWNHHTVGEVMPTPAYWEGTLYVATGGGRLLALDPADGHTLWELKLPGWVSMSSPSIKDGMLFVGSLNSVVGVDLRKRAIRWKYEEFASFTDVPPAVSDNGTVVVTGMKRRGIMTPEEKRQYPQARRDLHFIYAFDGSTGKLLWKDLLGAGAPQKNNTSGNPTIVNGRVYVGSPYTLSMFGYDLKTGERLWEYPVGTKVKGAPVVKDGILYFGDTSGYLHAIAAAYGTVLLKKNGSGVNKLKLGGSRTSAKNVALAPGGPVIIGQNLFVGSQDGFVYRVSIPDWIGPDVRRQR
jgi:outer membrane protein assembly factor BamB